MADPALLPRLESLELHREAIATLLVALPGCHADAPDRPWRGRGAVL